MGTEIKLPYLNREILHDYLKSAYNYIEAHSKSVLPIKLMYDDKTIVEITGIKDILGDDNLSTELDEELLGSFGINYKFHHKVVPRLNILYTKFLFTSGILLDINDELKGTDKYRHKLKYLVKSLDKELENITKLDVNSFYKDVNSQTLAINTDRAISDIIDMLSQMTLNDLLHTRDNMITYLKTPDSIRINNLAKILPLEDKYRLQDIITN